MPWGHPLGRAVGKPEGIGGRPLGSAVGMGGRLEGKPAGKAVGKPEGNGAPSGAEDGEPGVGVPGVPGRGEGRGAGPGAGPGRGAGGGVTVAAVGAAGSAVGAIETAGAAVADGVPPAPLERAWLQAATTSGRPRAKASDAGVRFPMRRERIALHLRRDGARARRRGWSAATVAP